MLVCIRMQIKCNAGIEEIEPAAASELAEGFKQRLIISCKIS